MFKKIGFSLLALFLAFRTYEQVNGLLRMGDQNFSALVSVLVSMVLVVFVTGVFAFPGFVFPTSRMLPEAYYRIRHPAALLRLYHWLGVDYFRQLLLLAYWGKDKQRKKYFDGSKAGIANLDYQTRQSEFGHLAAFLVLLLIALRLWIAGYTGVFIGTTVLNIFGNAYPIILQRVHRIRIQALHERMG
ncbi:hypothetical protein [Cyclobacterium xiamenense]|jgi:predicted PurR-regulated permease PerM|uniref:glycosyl-4,4'-diaponeurosporenoate acyltransferase CrtO family protein n=1 Tax=Cyclobacterium xiamenense TaxID=1297121 RepID=UPI0035D0E31B